MERHDISADHGKRRGDDLQLRRPFCCAWWSILRGLRLVMQGLRVRHLADIALLLVEVVSAMVARSVAIASALVWRADQAFALARLAGASRHSRDLSSQNFCLLLLMSCGAVRHCVVCSCGRCCCNCNGDCGIANLFAPYTFEMPSFVCSASFTSRAGWLLTKM